MGASTGGGVNRSETVSEVSSEEASFCSSCFLMSAFIVARGVEKKI